METSWEGNVLLQGRRIQSKNRERATMHIVQQVQRRKHIIGMPFIWTNKSTVLEGKRNNGRDTGNTNWGLCKKNIFYYIQETTEIKGFYRDK